MRTIVLSVTLFAGLLVCCFMSTLANTQQAGAQGCTFILSFKTLADTVPDAVGSCVNDIQFTAEGAVQQTTNGTFHWNRATNVTYFTNGVRTWLLGPEGFQTRLNSDRFDWERTATIYEAQIEEFNSASFAEGREIFRFDTFGSEAFWGGQLKLHQTIAGAANGGVGPGLSPSTALQLGLKVDSAMLPAEVVSALRAGQVDLNDPATTLALLQADAVVGVKGFFNEANQLESVGIRCSLCHSTVDDSFAAGIGERLDGWPNQDLNVGAIVAFAPDLSPFANLLQVSEDTVREVVTAWGPGKFDAQLTLDGKGFTPDGRPAATLIPPAFGMAGVNLHTWTADWGNVTYWNAFVANLEMHGQGVFFDPRLNNPEKYPVATRAGLFDVRSSPDLITSKLPALHNYQLALPAPEPPAGSFDPAAAARGQQVFNVRANCARCHVPPIFTEPGYNAHLPSEIGIDAFQADRAPDGRYRTSVLKGLFAHSERGFFHDGRFPTLLDVVNHYDDFFDLGLTQQEKDDLVEYLKSL